MTGRGDVERDNGEEVRKRGVGAWTRALEGEERSRM